jgi:hypothetical protein
MEAIENAAENDILEKELEYGKKAFDENGDEIPDCTLKFGPRPEKYRFKLVTNLNTPFSWGCFDRVFVPLTHRPKTPGPYNKKPNMIFDKRTGKLEYYPRKYAFEVVFQNQLLYSRLDKMRKNLENVEWPPDLEKMANKIISMLNAPHKKVASKSVIQ